MCTDCEQSQTVLPLEANKKHFAEKKYITVLNVIACLAVVLLHSNGVFWIFSTEPYWITANIIECVFYFAVPVFFMITGATLIDYNKKYNTKTFVKKRVIKTLIPFVVFSIIGFVFAILVKSIDIKNYTFKNFINDFVNSRFTSIYWFFIALFAIYIAIPLLANVKDEKKQTVFLYIIIVAFVLNSLLPLIFSVCKLDYNNDLRVIICGGSLIYPLIGYYIDNYKISFPIRIVIYVCGVLGLLAHILGTYFLSVKSGYVDGLLKGYLNVPCILYSSAIFLAFKNIENSKGIAFLHKFLKPVSGCTFGVYLIHIYVLYIFSDVLKLDRFSLWYRLGIGIATFVICLGLVALFKLLVSLVIKLIKKIRNKPCGQ